MIRITNLSKTYRTRDGERIDALRDIDLDVAENEFVTVLGASGCGKSTLLKIVVGLVPATTGEVHIRDTLVNGPRHDVGMVFQNPVMLPWRNVLDNVLFPIEILKLEKAAYRSQAEELLALVGLGGFENKNPRELSGGMQQRAAICRALIHDPTLLLMDEPFGALDALTREEMTLELMRIWEERKKTVIFVTHSIPEAVFLADRVVVMTPRPGTIAEVIEVDLPRPRNLDVEFTPTFKEYTDLIRSHIFAKASPGHKSAS